MKKYILFLIMMLTFPLLLSCGGQNDIQKTPAEIPENTPEKSPSPFGDNPIEKYGTPLWSFNLISDIHLGMGPCQEKHFTDALEMMKKYNQGAKLILSAGDQADSGLETQYDKMFSIYRESEVNVPLLLSVGNHDRSNGKYKKILPENYERFAGIVSETVYYSYETEEACFIMLGSEVYWNTSSEIYVYISEEQFEWFGTVFDKAVSEGKLIFVSLHEPFFNTVSGSFSGQGWHGTPSSGGKNYYMNIQKKCGTYANCFVLTGHTHWAFESVGNVMAGEGVNANFVNCSSLGYLWYGEGGGYGIKDDKGNYTGSEGYFVYVFEDKAVFRGWDFENDRFVEDFVFPLK